MIREPRSMDKLTQYYQKFMNTGVLDPNIHPWVAQSWQASKAHNVPNERQNLTCRLAEDELTNRQDLHNLAIEFIGSLYQQIQQALGSYSLSLLLIDPDFYILKHYSLPFFQITPYAIEGVRVAEHDIGTTSISLAAAHQSPCLLFGPEMWCQEHHPTNACSVPVLLPESNEFNYILTLVTPVDTGMPPATLMPLLLSMQFALEQHLQLVLDLRIKCQMLDAIPYAAYHISASGRVEYANKQGLTRLNTGHGSNSANRLLPKVLNNYTGSPLAKGSQGIPAFNKEMIWSMSGKVYEDIVTVLPINSSQQPPGIVALSLPLEELRMLAAHTAGYRARYHLSSMVGTAPTFVAVKEKAARVARHHTHIVLQGEPGTGKQRLAHGIHQASPRAAAPLITISCNATAEHLMVDLFGDTSITGKVVLANNGTLFLDEVESLPIVLADRLATVLAEQKLIHADGSYTLLDVRIIAACDSDLKRLTDKGAFSTALYAQLQQILIKVPNLVSRRSDIPLLAQHILTELAGQNQLPDKKLTPAASTLLSSFHWPGNTKQLQEVVEAAFFHTTGSVIDVDNIRLPEPDHSDNSWKNDREAFISLWKTAGGNISKMANLLGVSRVTLYRYFKKYELDQ